MIKARELLIYLAIRYRGDYDQMIDAIRKKEVVSEDAVIEAFNSVHSATCTILDDDYPPAFKQIYKPPLVLFYYGDWTLTSTINNHVSVIGTRKPTDYGLRMTKQIVGGLIERGQVIVSGLAYGIDAMAHQTAIEKGGQTIAVLGSGVDTCYPTSNQKLYQTIREHHLLISEYPGTLPAHKEHFPARNRLVAALSEAIFVAEAHERSGTLITVAQALAQGKDIYCLPYPADCKSVCNVLIKDGAYLVESANDIIHGSNNNETVRNLN
ncbi:MAG TPA: DNA-processing protein DprA [Bacilli bacterium]|jgi:DNA processing protein|nr:DNA-processing protein DprA [Bacilli bacterium]MDD4344328.1 DNA-processing protein DprA [Bacilli bacterium]MDD4520958.1 DNA-processing protein DprA [Bacilli bacterium]HKM10954.1 DNA-processing protein DprA [Bacilli bacterium]